MVVTALMRAVVAGFVLLAALAMAETPLGPEETVRRYLGALKAGKYADAYDVLSKAMRQGKDREVWVKETTAMMAVAEVKIFEFDVGTAKVEGDVARVPNVLQSQDRFVNQIGLTEYELYTLVREGGTWKVDSQLLLEQGELPKWFPKLGKGAAAAPSAH